MSRGLDRTPAIPLFGTQESARPTPAQTGQGQADTGGVRAAASQEPSTCGGSSRADVTSRVRPGHRSAPPPAAGLRAALPRLRPPRIRDPRHGRGGLDARSRGGGVAERAGRRAPRQVAPAAPCRSARRRPTDPGFHEFASKWFAEHGAAPCGPTPRSTIGGSCPATFCPSSTATACRRSRSPKSTATARRRCARARCPRARSTRPSLASVRSSTSPMSTT